MVKIKDLEIDFSAVKQFSNEYELDIIIDFKDKLSKKPKNHKS